MPLLERHDQDRLDKNSAVVWFLLSFALVLAAGGTAIYFVLR